MINSPKNILAFDAKKSPLKLELPLLEVSCTRASYRFSDPTQIMLRKGDYFSMLANIDVKKIMFGLTQVDLLSESLIRIT